MATPRTLSNTPRNVQRRLRAAVVAATRAATSPADDMDVYDLLDAVRTGQVSKEDATTLLREGLDADA